MSSAYHIPVLLHAGTEALITNPNGTYVDATFGGGGHSRVILKKLSSQGKLFCFDQDPAAENNFIREFSATNSVFIPQNFRYMQKFLRVNGVEQVDGIFADLGVSSHQFDEASRGFSTRFDAKLDMRMNTNQQLSAYDVVNTYSQEQLKKLFGMYGEVHNANQLAHIIINARNSFLEKKGKGIETTGELKNIALTVARGERNTYLAKMFQAIRIEVNDEVGALHEMLESSVSLLKQGGRLVVISYHSIEDRMTKNIIKTGNVFGEEHEDMMGRKTKYFKNISGKPVMANEEEVRNNPRARSAKMRIGERV